MFLLPSFKTNYRTSTHQERTTKMNIRNEIKSYIAREGITMSDLVAKLSAAYGWSASVPNLSEKLKRGSLRYREAQDIADLLGYEIVWQRRRERI